MGEPFLRVSSALPGHNYRSQLATNCGSLPGFCASNEARQALAGMPVPQACSFAKEVSLLFHLVFTFDSCPLAPGATARGKYSAILSPIVGPPRRGKNVLIAFATTLLLVQFVTVAPAQDTGPLPHVETTAGVTRLIVDGQPWLIRGGELGNSSASDLAYLKPHWPRLVELGLNTVLAPVYWDLIEPAEGQFDFSLVDGLLADARKHNLRLVLLWFGAWKNSMSCYVPGWVKRDQERFPRCESSAGKGLEILSPLDDANLEADRRAFVALMKHLREVDSAHQTVLMVQVENEIGMIPEARDYSATADEAFAAPVPSELMAYLTEHKETLIPEFRELWQKTGFETTGNWEQCFGRGPAAEEIFMAWNFARYVDQLAAAGKAEYPLPMFVNAALIRPGYLPGKYPSAGPLPHLMDVWRAGAPAIDFFAPDIYFPNFVEWCDKYARNGNPLFIPEVRHNAQNAANALWAFGEHDAIGVSPFSIESVGDPKSDAVGKCYRLISELTPLLLEHQGRETMVGVAPRIPFDEKDVPSEQKVKLGEYELTASFIDPWLPITPGEEGGGKSGPAGGLIIAIGPDEFLVAGTCLTITFAPADGVGQAGIESIQEGRFVDGKWTPGRWLNGDQSHQGRHLRIPAHSWEIQKVKLYRYK